MRLRVSVVGLGMAVDAHAKALLELQDSVEVRWAAARSQESIAQFSARYPFPVTTDVDHAILDPAVDAVIILTPPATHLEIGQRALNGGKHLLVEKPLEVDSTRALALVEAAEQSGRRLGVVLQHRFRPSTLRARALLSSGAIGDVQAASVSIPWWRAQTYYDEPGRGTLARDGGGVLMTQAIHTLDVFRSLVGVESVVAAQARTTALHRMEAEDFAAALLVLGNGAPGTLLATTAAYPGKRERIEVIGSRGSLWINGEAIEFHPLDGDRRDEEQAPPEERSRHAAHRDLIADFADALASGREPGASGRDALATQRLIDDILATARRGSGAA